MCKILNTSKNSTVNNIIVNLLKLMSKCFIYRPFILFVYSSELGFGVELFALNTQIMHLLDFF